MLRVLVKLGVVQGLHRNLHGSLQRDHERCQGREQSPLSYTTWKGTCTFTWYREMDVTQLSVQKIGLDAIKGSVTCELRDLVTCRMMA